MPTIDAFKADTFSMTSLTGRVDRLPYVPGLLAELGIFEPDPVQTRSVFVDVRDGEINLIPSTPTGSPPVQLERDDRGVVSLRTTRLAKSFTLYAHEAEGIRGFGRESDFMALAAEYTRRQARIRQDLELTEEYHRLGALQGKVMDADGVTVIEDYYDKFGIAEPAVITFDFSDTSTDVRQIINDLGRSMGRSAKGAFQSTTRMHALAGDEFYDSLIKHPSVKEFYLNHAKATELKDQGPWESFRFGACTFHNYRGSDDNSTVAVPVGEAKFFPVGARDVFKKAQAPAEFGPFINTMGRPAYALNIIDQKRAAFTEGELYAYPLYICQKPEVLRSGVVG